METKRAVEILTNLAQETRLDLVRLLIGEGAGGLSAGVIAERLVVPPSTLSFRLNALERVGVLRATRSGRNVVYAVRAASLRTILEFLTDTCCGSDPSRRAEFARLLPDPTVEDEDNGMVARFNVLFVCTHNSARSIMAESVLNKLGAGRFHAWSAGSDPAAAPMPEVLAKLAALGHDVSGLRSKDWAAFAGAGAPRMDFVIALCDTLSGQTCPDFGDRALTAAWPLPDPAKFSGGPAERATLMNELYASLRRRIEIFISLPFATLDRLAMKARLDEIGIGRHAEISTRRPS